MGYGVTAWSEDDALAILKSKVFNGQSVPAAVITADVDVSTLDTNHIRPNMGAPNWRGIWHPQGLAENSN
jgi:hypothetical protein